MIKILFIGCLFTSTACYSQKDTMKEPDWSKIPRWDKIVLVEADSLNKLKVGIDYKPTKYKSGYVFYEQHGAKVTLLRWVHEGAKSFGVYQYRWRCRIEIERIGGSALCWFDDKNIEKYSKQNNRK